MDHQTTTMANVDGPGLAVARLFLGGLVVQDFVTVAHAMAPDVRLRALLPGGLSEWTGRDIVTGRFERWFGDTEQFDVIDASAGEVGGSVHVWWQFRLQAQRLGPGSFLIEQTAYADVEEPAGIVRLDLLCAGYRPESSDG